MADEICFQARVDPAKRCFALRDDEVGAIAIVIRCVWYGITDIRSLHQQHIYTCHAQQIEAIRTQTFEVCDTACKANADADGFPDHWLFHHRWANKAKGVKRPNGKERRGGCIHG